MRSLQERRSHGLSRERLALEVRRARRPFAVWLVLVTIGLAGAWIVMRNDQAHLPWQGLYTVRMQVDDAKGVVAGAQEVKLAGIVIGKVARVERVHGTPLLTLKIKRRYAPLYRDARLRLRPLTPLQDMYVAVERRGTPRAGELPDGGTVPAAQTQSPVDISRVLNIFDPQLRGRMRQWIAGSGIGLRDRGRSLRAALVQLTPFLRAAARLSRANAERTRQTRRLVHNFRLMVAELGGRDRQLAKLVRGGSESLRELAANDEPLAGTLHELPPTLGQIRATFADLRRAEDQLDPALQALLPVAEAAPAGFRGLRDFSREARPALATLRRPVRLLDPFARALRPTAASLHTAFAALRPQAPRLDHITSAVVPCELAVQKFFQWSLSVFKLSDANGVSPRGAATFGTTTPGGLVKDPNMRRSRSCADQGAQR